MKRQYDAVTQVGFGNWWHVTLGLPVLVPVVGQACAIRFESR
jgi:hypothetical protein